MALYSDEQAEWHLISGDIPVDRHFLIGEGEETVGLIGIWHPEYGFRFRSLRTMTLQPRVLTY